MTKSHSLSGTGSELDYLLDTNIVIGLRDGDVETLATLKRLQGVFLVSVVSRVELEGGVVRDANEAQTRRERLDRTLRVLVTVDFDEAAVKAYGRIVDVTGYSRRKLLDRMIAAQALVHRATLITRNAADFQDVPGLELLTF